MQDSFDRARREHPFALSDTRQFFKPTPHQDVKQAIERGAADGEAARCLGDGAALVEAMALVRRCQRDLRVAVAALRGLLT